MRLEVDERRSRINDDLRGILGERLVLEAVPRSAYALDASPFEVDPLGVIMPRSLEDLVTTVRYAAENQIPIHARGAGTGRNGGSIGPGFVIDFSRHFRRVIDIQPDKVVVQPGLVLDELNTRLAPLGRRVGPDPVGSATATIGGLIGLDAAGPCALRYGSIGDHVERLKVVFASGETASIGYEPWPRFDDEPADLKALIVKKLGALMRRNMDLLVARASQPGRGRSGYALARSASGMGIQLPRLIAGSGGTLALVTEVTLRTVPIPPAPAGLLLPFGRIADAAAAAGEALGSSPAACELFDWRMITLAREASPQFRQWIADSAEAILLLLFEGENPEEVASRANRLADRIARTGVLPADPVLVTRRVECERLMGLRDAVLPFMMRMRGPLRPAEILDGIAVPPDHLGEMILRLQNIMKDHSVSWALEAHAGDGRLHPMPFLDLSDARERERLGPLAIDVFEAALDLGGSVPSELGFGPSRHHYLRRQLGDLLPVYRGVKDAFDPENLFNPGLVIGDDPGTSARDLRAIPSPTASGEMAVIAQPEPEPETAPSIFLPVLRWGERGPVETAAACNGCGACRTRLPTERMCPTFRALREETATPRALANLVRQLSTGKLDPKLWGTEEVQASARLCTHCKLCPQECPSGVDVSSLMIEAKAAYVESHGLPPGEWALSRIEMWGRIGSRLPIVTNAVLASRPTRWLLERLLGLSRLRRLPKAHRSPFVRRAARLGLTRPRPQEPGPRVAYFVDVYANHFDQELAESVVAVLRHAGVNVFVPPGQRDCGMPSLVAGDVEHARELALANLRILGNAVRDGYTIVCSEPTAALMLRQEYLKLTDDLDAALVAEHTHDIGQYLAGLDERGQLPEPDQPLRAKVGYHQPCHLRALNVGTPGLDLIRRIPEVEVEFIDRGCSGMAGTFGLHKDHFLTSLRAGRSLLSRLEDADIEFGATECSACRIQMEQGAPKRTLHPIKLLSLAYGHNPSLRRRLRDVKSRRGVT